MIFGTASGLRFAFSNFMGGGGLQVQKNLDGIFTLRQSSIYKEHIAQALLLQKEHFEAQKIDLGMLCTACELKNYIIDIKVKLH